MPGGVPDGRNLTQRIRQQNRNMEHADQVADHC
jgi:hypothetical protein